MLILGITGRARSGKSTVAMALALGANKHGLSSKTYDFSSYVIKDLQTKGSLPKDFTREDMDENGIRDLVNHGSGMRAKDPYYWIDRLFDEVFSDKPDLAIVPGVRFINEAQEVHTAEGIGNGKILRVKALVRDGTEWISPDRDPNHYSETEQDLIQADYFLTAKKGESVLLKLQGQSLLEYILHERHN
jgi:hypothetical protein